MNTAQNLVELVRSLIKEELAKQDNTEFCQIVNVNELTGNLDIILFSDPDTILPNISNASKYTFKTGDTGVLFKMGNQLNNCFVITKTNI